MNQIITFPEPLIHKELLILMRDARTAKRIIGLADIAYEKVRGEVRRTDILYAVFLKEFYRGLFWLFVKKKWDGSDSLARLLLDNPEPAMAETPEWKNLISNLGDKNLESACEYLVKYLTEHKSIQSAASDIKYQNELIYAVDNRNRNAEFLPDQVYLNAVSDWKSDSSSTLVEGLTNDKSWSARFEYFYTYLAQDVGVNVDNISFADINDYIKFTEQVILEGLRKHKENATDDNIVGFIPLWRTFVNSSLSNTSKWREIKFDWCIKLGEIAMLTSFPFFIAFEYYWLSDKAATANRDETESGNVIKQIREKRWEKFENLNSGDRPALLSALPDNPLSKSRWCLVQFMTHAYVSSSNEIKFPYKDNRWSIALEIFEKMLRQDPHKASLYISGFFVRSTSKIQDGYFDEKSGNYIQRNSSETKWRVEFDRNNQYLMTLLKSLLIHMPSNLSQSDEACMLLFKEFNTEQ